MCNAGNVANADGIPDLTGGERTCVGSEGEANSAYAPHIHGLAVGKPSNHGDWSWNEVDYVDMLGGSWV